MQKIDCGLAIDPQQETAGMNTPASARWITLESGLAQAVRGWLAMPRGTCRGALVVVQEIYGVNAHIRATAETYAEAGYAALAPCMFDLVASGTELDYSDAETQRGRVLAAEVGMDNALRVVAAAAAELSGLAKVGVVGYCWGGAVAFLSATRLGLPAVSYYGRLVEQFLHERPQAPIQFHFGEKDPLIPLSSVDRVAAALPDAPVYTYPAGHAFNRLGDSHGDPESAATATERALRFFQTHLTAP